MEMEATMDEAVLEDLTAYDDHVERDGFYEVYHRILPTFLDSSGDTLAAFPAGFMHVADVRTDDVGRVFQLTNTIDGPWWENPQVTPAQVVKTAGGARSTSVGDVIVRGARRWTIQMIGLKEF